MNAENRTLPPIAENDASQYTLSLFLFPEGVNTIIAHNGNLQIAREYYFPYSIPSTANNNDNTTLLADTLYDNPFLLYNYSKVRIFFVANSFVAIPPAVNDNKLSSQWLSFSSNDNKTNTYVGTFNLSLPQAPLIVARGNAESLNFLRRTYIGATIFPSIVALTNQTIKQSLTSPLRVASILVSEEKIEIALALRGEVLYCNTLPLYTYKKSNQQTDLLNLIIYYWSAMCKSYNIEWTVGDRLNIIFSPAFEHTKDLTKQLDKIFEEMGVSINFSSITEL